MMALMLAALGMAGSIILKQAVHLPAMRTSKQDNIQQVARQMMCFFTDLGFTFPPFSFTGWSRGWTAEDMDKNVMLFKKSEYIKRTSREMIDNCVEMLKQIKGMDASKIVAPKPHIKDSPSSELENFDMNL